MTEAVTENLATKYVMALAGRECTECHGKGVSQEKDGSLWRGSNPFETTPLWKYRSCGRCQGTGAEFPGLRRECKGRVYRGPNPLDPGTMDGPRTYRCWTLQVAPCDTPARTARCPGGCQGQGWVLIPEAEWLGVGVRMPGFDGLSYNGDYYTAGYRYPAIATERGETPEEAVFKALCQALGQPVEDDG